MNILIINQPLNNRGDESAHKALVRKILSSFNNVSINCLWVAVEKTINYANIDSYIIKNNRVQYKILSPFGIWKSSVLYVRLLKYFMERRNKWILLLYPTFRQLIAYYKKSDLILCAPGGICMGGFQDWRHLFMLTLAKVANKPLAYYGRSFGPFPERTQQNKLFKNISLEMIDYFSFLSIRDKKTECIAKSLNITNYFTTVDSAFLNTPNVDLPEEIVKSIGNEEFIVFVPNSLIWHFSYKDKVSYEIVIEFYCGLIDVLTKYYPQTKIVMLPQTFGKKDWLGDDINLFIDIRNHYKDNRLVIIDDTYDSDVQQTVISKAKLVVGARYHSIVFSINQSRPFIALSYEHKIAGLLETLNCKEQMIDISETLFSKDKIQETYHLFEDKLANLNTNIYPITCKAKEIADNCFYEFHKYLKQQYYAQ